MTTFGDMLYQFGGVPVGPLGIGNVYFVIKTNEPYYSAFLNEHQGQYPDGTWRVHSATAASSHTAIQAALDACVEGRNDYVILQPSDSDYDITAALTLSKKSVHLVCPAGLGLERGATNACRIHQNTAETAIFAVSDASIEIAGFYLKPYADASHITIAATSYGLNIHHNYFPLQWTTTPAEAILCAGDGGAWGQVSHHNIFVSQGGDDVTCASLITIGSSATGARCDHNDIFIGDGNVLTSAITNSATKGTTNYNTFMVAAGDGTITTCITQGSYGVAIGNRACVGADALVTGGTDDISAVDNMNSLAGGTIADDLD
jgi:hypothetical protein